MDAHKGGNMKWRGKIAFVILALVLVAVFAVATPAKVSAAPPLPDVQPWMFLCARDAGFGTLEQCQIAFGNFQVAQAIKYNYTPAQWELFYNRDVTVFLSQRGCASCRISDDDVLSYKMKIDLPIALCDAGKGQCAD
jgi:hypothetical protein